MFNDFTVRIVQQQRERELTERLERRRIAAERAVQEHGSRLAVVAYLAREGRARRAPRTRPVGP